MPIPRRRLVPRTEPRLSGISSNGSLAPDAFGFSSQEEIFNEHVTARGGGGTPGFSLPEQFQNQPPPAAVIALDAPFENHNQYLTLQFAGTASTQILPGNALRTYLLIQNQSSTVNLFINFGQDAGVSNGSIQIIPGGNYLMDQNPPRNSIYLFYPGSVSQVAAIVEGTWKSNQ